MSDLRALAARLALYRPDHREPDVQDIDCIDASIAIYVLLDAKEAAERERDRAVEVADAETKGVYSKYMLEAADAIAENRHLRIALADAEHRALERAAEVCDEQWRIRSRSGLRPDGAMDCAAKIRALQQTPP